MIDGPVRAAGAVVWRIHDGELHLLLIHRTRHRDVSLPKGKVDPGETLPETAVREIAEETGIAVTLGVPLGTVRYPIASGREKSVRFWAAEATDEAILASTFLPNDEVAAIEWLPADEAMSALSYQTDREILDVFLGFAERGELRTFALIALRHGKALARAASSSLSDADRPLTERGHAQARAVAPVLAAYGPRRIVSSTALRCRQTVLPLSVLLGRRIRETEAISQDAWEADESDVRAVIGKRIRSRKTAVLCSHGPVLPEIVREIALGTATISTRQLAEAADLDVGEFSVFHLSAERPSVGILAVERSADLA